LVLTLLNGMNDCVFIIQFEIIGKLIFEMIKGAAIIAYPSWLMFLMLHQEKLTLKLFILT